MNLIPLTKEELLRRQAIIKSLGLEIASEDKLFGYFSYRSDILIDFSAIDPNSYGKHALIKLFTAGYDYGIGRSKEIFQDVIASL